MFLLPLFWGSLWAEGPAFAIQAGLGQSKLAAVDLASATGTLLVDATAQQGFTLRGSAIWALDPRWGFEATLGWRARSSGSLDYRSSAAGSGTLDVKETLSSQFLLGALALRRFGDWGLGAGLDLRSENVAAEVRGASSGATLSRPWLRGVARYAFRGAWRPYVALEAAFPLSKSAPSAAAYIQDLDRMDTASNPSAGTVAKAHAPASEFLLAIGLRFPK